MHAVKDNLGKRAARKRKTSAIRDPRRCHLGGFRLQLQGAWALNLWPCPLGGSGRGPRGGSLWREGREQRESKGLCLGWQRTPGQTRGQCPLLCSPPTCLHQPHQAWASEGKHGAPALLHPVLAQSRSLALWMDGGMEGWMGGQMEGPSEDKVGNQAQTPSDPSRRLTDAGERLPVRVMGMGQECLWVERMGGTGARGAAWLPSPLP